MVWDTSTVCFICFCPYYELSFNLGQQQGVFVVSVDVINSNVCGFNSGVNPNFWFGIFFFAVNIQFD